MKNTELQQILNDHKLWLDSNGERGARANLEKAYLYNADFYKANLENANFINADLENAHLYNADLEGANLENANLENANLYKANLENANLYKANLGNTNLENANLENANLENANLKYANITGATGIYSFGSVGDEKRIGYAVKHDTCVMIQLGCFWGTSDEAIEAVQKKYGENSTYEKQIRLAVEILESEG